MIHLPILALTFSLAMASASPLISESQLPTTAEECAGLSFAQVFPPTAAELACQKLTGRDAPLTLEECKNAVFIAIYPPPPAKLACDKLLAEHGYWV